MNANADELDLKDRLSLIETMIAEGRRKTESWGWTFVLWGVAYYVAIAWSAFGRSNIAWPVTMIAASILMGILISRRAGKSPETTLGRAMAAIWIATGVSLFTLLMALGVSGRYDFHVFVAIIGAFLGCTNAASSIMLRWKMQFACAVVWWAAAVAAVFATDIQVTIVFLVAIFFCQIVFGIYGMVREASKRRQDASHA